ncbi:MAG: NAD(P)H-dependent oxidoreductase [Clostridiales bacterium]|nr:NAD(P)H-dependent oxidoreductase [Clostridiales bacterium]
MNYLFINGSPRKGNTWMLAEELKNGIARLSPDSVFDEIQLSGMGLPFCTGCSLCFRKGHSLCPHSETVQAIIDKIDWADGIVWATATYNMQPTALTKNLMDHLCFMLHRPYFFTKKAVVVSTVGGVGVKQCVKYLAGMLRGIGFNRCYEFPVAAYSWDDFKMSEKLRGKCAKLASAFHADVSSKKLHSPTWLQLIPYNLFRGMSLKYVSGSEFETCDGAHWASDFRSGAAYDPAVPVPFFKRWFGNVFYLLGKLMSSRITITYRK